MDTPLWRSVDEQIKRFWRSVLMLWKKCIKPLSSDEDLRRREYILNIILAGSMVMLLLLDSIVVYDYVRFGGSLSMISIPTFSMLPALFVFLYALSRRGHFILASYVLVIAYFLGNSYAIYRWGINVPTALLGYALLIVIASILLGTRFAFFLTAVIAMYLLPIWYVQLNGLLLVDREHSTFGDGIALAILYFLIVVIAWLSNREIERSLDRARNSERELKEERDLLEVKVEERTRELQIANIEKIDDLYRFAEFGQLASGLFHDLTSILNAVALRTEHHSYGKSDGSAEQNAVAGQVATPLEDAFAVQKEIDRFVDAVRDQLRHESREDLFNLADTVLRAIHLLSHKSKTYHVEILFENADSWPGYFGYASKFHQVVMNLLMNAIDAFADMPYQPDAPRRVAVRLGAEVGEFVLVVEDNASGIPEDIQAKIFEPFFTTKHGSQKGIGIGLAMTKRIVESDFAGTIMVESSVGKGSRFTVRFPMKFAPSSSSNEQQKFINPTNESTYGVHQHQPEKEDLGNYRGGAGRDSRTTTS